MMFIHNFKYNLFMTLRDKGQIFWSLIFVIVLGTLFRVTFKDAYEKSEITKDIKVAVYIENDEIAKNFSDIIENISLDETYGDKLLDVTYAKSMKEAQEILDEDDTEGLFYTENGELKLIVKDEGIRQSILSSIASQYHQILTIVKSVSSKSPDKIAQVMVELIGGESNNTEKTLTKGNMDVFLQYFYNLIAMSCLFASFSGITFTIRNQANLSSIGARKSVSDMRLTVSTVSGLLANLVILFVCTCASMLYLYLIGVSFGDKIGMIMLVVFVGTMLGLSMGYFIGSIGVISAKVKEALGVGVSLLLCFLSGLMVGDMRMIMENISPIINKFNPAVLISDSFYALSIYENYDRFTNNIVTLLIISVILIIGGIIMGGRKRYASV